MKCSSDCIFNRWIKAHGRDVPICEIDQAIRYVIRDCPIDDTRVEELCEQLGITIEQLREIGRS